MIFFDAEGTLWIPQAGRTLKEFWERPTREHARIVFQPAPGIHQALARLSAAGCRLVVLSRHDPQLLPSLLEEFKVAVFFEDVLVNGDKGERAALWLHKQGIAHGDALMVGDRQDLDIDPLKRVRIPALLVDRPDNQQVAHPRLYDWSELVKQVEADPPGQPRTSAPSDPPHGPR